MSVTTPDQPPTPETPVAEPSPGRPKAPGAPVRLLRRLHFYAGVLVAPFLLVAAVSGALYALAPAAEQVIYRAQLHTDSTGSSQSIAAQIAAARAERPDLTVTAVRPAHGAGDTTRVLFDDPSLPSSTSLAVFVDPVTLDVQGSLPSYGSTAALPVRTWLSDLHRNLHLGEPGRWYSELAASWLWVIALAGMALWIIEFRKKRRSRGSGNLMTVDRKAKRRTRTINWHAVTGMWIVVGLVFLSATGLTWSRFAGENVSELRSALNWTQPTVDTALTPSTGDDDAGGRAGHGHGGHDHGAPAPSGSAEIAADNAGYADTALALARSVGVGRGDAVQIGIPSDDDTAFTVTEVRAPWQFSPNTAVVDPAADRVVGVNWFADWPVAAQLASLGIALHMGLLFGLLNQLALFAVAVALIAVIVLGYRMWWQRRPRSSGPLAGSRRPRNAHRPGRAPARGALTDLPWPAIGAVAVVAVTVSWFIPLLGWPLLAFLVIDVAVGLWQRTRATAGADVP